MRRTQSPRLASSLHSWTSSRQGRDPQAWISHQEWNTTMVKPLRVNQGVCALCLLHPLLHPRHLHLGTVKGMVVWPWATATAPSAWKTSSRGTWRLCLHSPLMRRTQSERTRTSRRASPPPSQLCMILLSSPPISSPHSLLHLPSLRLNPPSPLLLPHCSPPHLAHSLPCTLPTASPTPMNQMFSSQKMETWTKTKRRNMRRRGAREWTK